MQEDNAEILLPNDDSDDDFDWEEVTVPIPGQDQVAQQHYDSVEVGSSNVVKPNIEITIQARPRKDDAEKQRRAALQAERANRLNCHKVHTVILLGNAQIRNKWINDPLLHARLMSLVPLKLQSGFVIHKSRVPEAAMRGRMFESAVVRLVDWWCNHFTILPTGHIKSRTYEEVQKEILDKMERANDKKGKRRARDEDEDDEDGGEVVRSEKSLMKHALQHRGCRDTSAQLFTALCRALGIPARLIVSLQSVPWQANGGKPKSSPKKKADRKGREKATGNGEDEDDMEMEEVEIPVSPIVNGKGKGRAFPGTGQKLDGSSTPPSPDKTKFKPSASPVINLRKSRGQRLGSAPVEKPAKRERSPDPLRSPPIFWTEVFSRADARWLPVDPVRGIVNKRKAFDPSTTFNTFPNTKTENRMVYVLAFEEDGYGRDVTARYAKEYGAKVSKLQQGGKGKKDWWERVMTLIRRPYRLNRDDLEDEELRVNQMTEQMPTTMTGFKNHPLYVLARHLRRDEVIHPLVELGKFRGEPVYPRSSVVSLKTAENWMRQGRRVREGCQPMKWVKQHAVTVNKKRAVEMALAERQDRMKALGDDQGEGFSSEKDVMQGLYAENQTEVYTPDPIVNGKIPKNDFGNIDLYVPSMLPAGGVHIPYKGAWKIARQLGFDYAEAVTGFEFKKRRALPVIRGIVVAAENEDALLEAYWAAEKDAEEKRQAKRQEEVIKRWQRLVQGLRIRQRLKEQYGDKAPQGVEIRVAVEENEAAGGFLATADDVVQPYSLPKNLHEVLPSPITDTSPAELGTNSVQRQHIEQPAITGRPQGLDVKDSEDQANGLEQVPTPSLSTGQATPSGAPKTMRELAEDAERKRREARDSPAGVDHEQLSVAQTPEAKTRTRSTGSGSASSAKAAKHGVPRVVLKLTPRRNRKRAREDDGEPGSSEGGGGEDQLDAAVAEPSPAKRSRARGADPPPAPRSDRVLRPRASKSAAKMQEEKEEEEAYRRAVAEY